MLKGCAEQFLLFLPTAIRQYDDEASVQIDLPHQFDKVVTIVGDENQPLAFDILEYFGSGRPDRP